MTRHKNPEDMTAREIIADVLRWADMSGFENIAAAMRRALSLMPAAEPAKRKRK
jgi:hypothetical protein